MSKTRKPTELKFKIDAYTPDTIPMARLAEYMTSLAKFLGEPAMVHFVKLEKGSTVLVQKIDTEAIPKIQARIERVKRGDAPTEEVGPYNTINEMLREDNGVGVLLGGRKSKLLKFPGREIEAPITYGGVSQEGTIDGIPIRIGGKNEIVPISIQEEEREYFCHARRNVAKRIAPHIFTSALRFSGRGRWHRDENGNWVLDDFMISDFIQLKDAPLSEVVDELRAVEGSEWDKLKDPWNELHKLQYGGDSDK